MSEVQRYPFFMAANGVQNIACTGKSFIVVSSLGAVSITLDIGGKFSSLQAGQGYTGRTFTGLSLQDASGAANSGFLLVADDEYIDRRITGEVSVIDGIKNKSLAGQNFISFAGQAAVAAAYSQTQILNPAGSGKNLIFYKVESKASAGDAFIGYGTTLLANISAAQPKNKFLTMPIGVGVQRQEANAALLYSNILGLVGSICTFSGPLIIPPGLALFAFSNTVNTILNTTYEWSEESV
jgi:hypothetical protein